MDIVAIRTLFIGSLVGIFLALVVAVIVSVVRAGNMKKDIAKIFKEKYPQLTYTPDKGISTGDYMNMHLLKIGDTYEATDNIAGKAYNGTEFNYCEVNTSHIKHELLRPTRSHRVVDFNGAVLSFKLDKIADGQILIRSKGLVEGNFGFDKNNVTDFTKVETEHVEFNDAFVLYSENGDEPAFYMLTPDVLENLAKLDKRYTWGIHAGFRGDIMDIAIPKLDLLEPDGLTINEEKVKKANQSLADQAVQEINYIISLFT